MAKNVAVSPRLWQNSAALESSQRCAWGKQEAKGIAKVRGVTGFLWGGSGLHLTFLLRLGVDPVRCAGVK